MSDPGLFDRSAIVCRTSKQVHCYLGERAVLMDVESGEYFEVNAVGTRIWKHLEQPTPVDRLIELLLDEFSVDEEQCASDVRRWLEKMRALGFVALEPAER